MRKHKLFIPIFVSLVILFIGTSLALSGLVSNDLSNEELPNDSMLELTAAEDQEQRLIEEEALEDAEQEDNEQIASIEKESEAEETKVVKEDDVEAKPEAEKPKTQPIENKPEAQPKAKQMARVTVNGLNVRPDPSTNNQRIDVLLQGQTVEVLTEQNNWLQVKLLDGRTGWISGAYVSRFTPSAGGGGALAGRVIVIDPGHGGTDPGAVGPTGLTEKEVNLDVSQRAASKLRDEGAKVIMTRDTDVFIPLAQRVSIAEAAGAEVFISVHANAHPNPLIGGTETYYFRNKGTSAASLQLATHMQRELVGALRLRDIGVKDASFLVIRQTTMPSILLELGFLSNAQEESLMRTNDFRQNAADAMVRALQNYFN